MFASDQKDQGAVAKKELDTVLTNMGAIFDFYYYRDKSKEKASTEAHCLMFQFTFLSPKNPVPSVLLRNIVNKLKLSKETVLLAFYYINVLHKHSDYLGKRDHGAPDCRTLLNKFSVHLLLISGLYRAHKSLSDGVIDKNRFAQIIDFPHPEWLEDRSQDLFELLAGDFINPDVTKKESDKLFSSILGTLDADYNALAKPNVSVFQGSSVMFSATVNVGADVKRVEASATAAAASSQPGAASAQPKATAKPTAAPSQSGVGVKPTAKTTVTAPQYRLNANAVAFKAPAASETMKKAKPYSRRKLG